MIKKNRAFLKWAGGKFKLVDAINQILPKGERLVEPFVGAGSVFLNADYSQYLLCDINPDVIGLYKIVQSQSEEYIAKARLFFTDEMNRKEAYYQARDNFNLCQDPFMRAVYFLYLNRHGFNGLCRYNRKGGFNVPFGTYKKPYFPEKEIRHFAEQAQRAEFRCIGYQQAFELLRPGDVVYCDPPYAPLSTTACFTSYVGSGFTLDDQALLARTARHTALEKGIPVVISNHDIPLTRELYHGAHLSHFPVRRYISQNVKNRQEVMELMAFYHGVYQEEVATIEPLRLKNGLTEADGLKKWLT